MTLQLIKHRCNTLKDLDSVSDLKWGVEIDLRASSEKTGGIYLAHDAWTSGEDFEEWLVAFKQKNINGPIILNTKEDGLEQRILDILKAYDVDSYFFLDTATPTLIKWTLKNKINSFALRLSCYEPTIPLNFDGNVEWVWVDCFDGTPLTDKIVTPFKERGFKVCLVSPELQGQAIEKLKDFSNLVVLADAICTKNPQAWIQHYGL